MSLARILVLALGLFILHYVTNGYCATIAANSPSQADVEDAISRARDGDKVIVPAGSASWDSAITLGNKMLTVQGAGMDATVVSAAKSFVIDGVEGKFVRLTGFTFKGGGSECMIAVYGTSKAWRIDNSKFDNITGAGIGVDGYTYGVIDHCRFVGTNLFTGVYVLDTTSNSGVSAWNRSLTLGTENAVYVEDCSFDFASFGPGIPSIDSRSGGRYVFRYNTIQNQTIGHHDAETANQRGTFSWEVYENTFTYTSPGWTAVYMRGGTGVIYNNKFSGTFTMGTPMSMTNSRSTGLAHGIPWLPPCDGTPDYMWSDVSANCTTPGEVNGNGAKCVQMDGQLDSTGYPCIDQLGRTNDANGDGIQDPAPAYEWNNTDPATGQVWDWNIPSEISMQLKEGRDYFKRTVKPGYTPYAYPHPLISEADGPAYMTAWGTGNFAAAFSAYGSGNGIWSYNGYSWSKLTDWVPDAQTSWGTGNLAGVFSAYGSGNGIWSYNGYSWSKLTDWVPDWGVSWGSNSIAGVFRNYGSGNGIWSYDGSSWTKLTDWMPRYMSSWGSGNLAAVFTNYESGNGIWSYNGSSWTKLTD